MVERIPTDQALRFLPFALYVLGGNPREIQSGRLVKRLRADDTSQSEGVLAWHGDDERGRALPAGVYLVRMRDGGEVISKKVVLQR